jgi:hypothetical protein
MMKYINFNRYDLGSLSLLIAIFVVLSDRFFSFTLDDAYITLRYSKHLAEGYGIVWNIGTDPVEGYTSFLWMIIGVIPHSIDLPPVTFMKIFGVVSTVLTIIVIYGYGRFRSINRWILIIGSAQIAVSPAVAVLSVQGMETTTAMLLVLFITISAIEVIRNYSTKWAVAMNIALLTGMLTRPDLVVFGIVLEVGLAALLYRQNRITDLKYLTLIGFLMVFLPGIVYMLSRYMYFGYIFPNAFYIKSGFSVRGPIEVFEFVMLLTGPVLFLTLATSLLYTRSRKVMVKMSPLFLAIVSFLSIYLYITPIQGFLYRFLMPVFPATILILMLTLNQSKLEMGDIDIRSWPIMRISMAVLIISGLFVYPLFTLDDAHSDTDLRTGGDRVEMGQALESTADEDYKMFVSESGALPYFSEWQAVDWLGLNNEQIAHSGLNQQFLTEYKPDLIMFLSFRPSTISESRAVLGNYLNNSSYALVAVVPRQNADGTHVQSDRAHLYFVNTESEGYRDITCTILTQDLKYGNKPAVAHQANINIQVSNITASDCD